MVKEEGVALVSLLEGGEEKVKPSEGAAGEHFIGFAYTETLTPLTKSLVEEAVIPADAPYTVALTRNTVLAGQVSVMDVDAGVAITAGDPANAGKFAINGNVLTFNAAQAGHTVKITFRYQPTANEILTMDRVLLTTQSATDFIGSIGVVMEGEIFTNMFDAGVNWEAATEVKMKAGGVLTDQTGSGSAIAGARIIHVPSVVRPFLGIRFGY
jgi:hypothetical protein